ncbi:MAG: GNAT family N-acetyltransferase [Peptostreptococcaceae bacterium]
MKLRYAKEDEINNIKEIWNYCFNDSEAFVKYYFDSKYKRGNTVVLDEGEEIVSSLQLNQYQIKLNNKVYDASYIVGVSTFPQVRGRGYMKHIMKFSLNELYKRGQLVSILMPIDYRLYRKYGYEHCYDQLEYTIDIEDLSRFKLNGKLYKVENEHIDDLIEINDLFLKDVNGNVARDKKYYENLFEEVKSEDGHIYIYEDNGYQGYIVYFLNGENMFVRELFYKNIEALKSMLKFIYNHNTQCKKVIISAPVNDKIRFVLDNPKTCDIKVKPFMMGRIINLKGYLESLDVNSDKELSVRVYIEDGFLSENNGVFKISLKNKKISVEKTEGSYSAYFSINTFTQLAFSYINIKEALILNDVDKDNIKEDVINLFNTIFEKKDNYINEYV